MKWTKTKLEKYLKDTPESKIVICYSPNPKDRKKFPESEGYKIINYIYMNNVTIPPATILTTETWLSLTEYEQRRVVSRLGFWLGYFQTAYQTRLEKFRRETSDLVS
jgi:hypothetical protein